MRKLSTPSLGITLNRLIDEMSRSEITFNSLSRDHGKEVPSPLEAEATLLSTPSLGIT